MGKYQTYPEYKDSRIGWMGHIPKDWLTVPVGRLFSRTKRTGHSEKELLSVYRDYGVIPKSSRDDNNNKESDDLTPYQLVQPNDLVMNKMKAWQGSIAISEFEGIVSPAYFVYEPRNILFDLAHPRYIHYLLRNPIYITQYMSRSKGIRVNQWDLDPDEFKTIELLLPSKNEQSKIFNFLDHETAKIDALIEKQQQLISLLQEKRQAVISHAVTKGLNPDAPMKDSGVEWLGQVPEHWVVTPYKYLTSEVTVGIVVTPAKYYVDSGVKCLRSLNVAPNIVKDERWVYISEESNRVLSKSRVYEGDIVVVRSGQTGTATVIPRELDGSNCIDLVIIRRSERICSTFACFQLNSDFVRYQVVKGSEGAIQLHFNVEVAKSLLVCLPPLAEQIEITAHLLKTEQKFEMLVNAAEIQINLLKERRTALISAAVTGKIDVRNWQAPSQSPTTSTEEQAL